MIESVTSIRYYVLESLEVHDIADRLEERVHTFRFHGRRLEVFNYYLLCGMDGHVMRDT